MKEITLPTREVVTQVVQDAFDFQMSGPKDGVGRPDGPMHFLDITASRIPLVVERWQLEQGDGKIVDLCLAGAVHTSSGSPELDVSTDMAFVVIFQVCEHRLNHAHCRTDPLRAITRTNQIGLLDATKRAHGCLGYMVLIFERDGVGVCTLLSPKLILPMEKRVILVVNPNHIEREFAIS